MSSFPWDEDAHVGDDADAELPQSVDAEDLMRARDLVVADFVDRLVFALVPALDGYITVFSESREGDMPWEQVAVSLRPLARYFGYALLDCLRMLDHLNSGKEPLSDQGRCALATADVLYPTARLLSDSLLLLARVPNYESLVFLPPMADVDELIDLAYSPGFVRALGDCTRIVDDIRHERDLRVQKRREAAEGCADDAEDWF